VRRVSRRSGGVLLFVIETRFENREISREQGRFAALKGSRSEEKYVSARLRRLLCVAYASSGRRRVMGRF
jgi:hypothetical protein